MKLSSTLGLLVLLATLAAVRARPHANNAGSASGPLAGHVGHAGHAGGHGARHHGHHPRPERPAGPGARARHHPHTTHEKRQLCGSGLSDALRSLCQGRGYNTMDSVSGTSSRHGHGSHKGLARECCDVGCSLKDLDKYCQPPKTPPGPESSEADTTESASLEAAHHENHIRPPEEEAASDPVPEAVNRVPTVTGARSAGELNMTKFEMMVNRTDMISVGTVPLPSQPPVFVHKQRLHSVSNSL